MSKNSIRRGVFETNSSSTHSLTMCSENEYDKWERGKYIEAKIVVGIILAQKI